MSTRDREPPIDSRPTDLRTVAKEYGLADVLPTTLAPMPSGALTVADRIDGVVTLLTDAKAFESRLSMFVGEGPSSREAADKARLRFHDRLRRSIELLTSIATNHLRRDYAPSPSVPHNDTVPANRIGAPIPMPPHIGPLTDEFHRYFEESKTEMFKMMGLPVSQGKTAFIEKATDLLAFPSLHCDKCRRPNGTDASASAAGGSHSATHCWVLWYADKANDIYKDGAHESCRITADSAKARTGGLRANETRLTLEYCAKLVPPTDGVADAGFLGWLNSHRQCVVDARDGELRTICQEKCGERWDDRGSWVLLRDEEHLVREVAWVFGARLQVGPMGGWLCDDHAPVDGVYNFSQTPPQAIAAFRAQRDASIALRAKTQSPRCESHSLLGQCSRPNGHLSKCTGAAGGDWYRADGLTCTICKDRDGEILPDRNLPKGLGVCTKCVDKARPDARKPREFQAECKNGHGRVLGNGCEWCKTGKEMPAFNGGAQFRRYAPLGFPMMRIVPMPLCPTRRTLDTAGYWGTSPIEQIQPLIDALMPKVR